MKHLNALVEMFHAEFGIIQGELLGEFVYADVQVRGGVDCVEYFGGHIRISVG